MTMSGRLRVSNDLLDAVASQLDLRLPNAEAVKSIAYAVSQHHDVLGRPRPFEGVVVSATAMGKTYVIAGALDYYASRGHRNFAIITPGRTILRKTIDNFTAGHPKSLLAGMSTRPLIVTADNFASAAMAAAFADRETAKLYVFTVQALLRPESDTGRRTHKFQEGLGKAFYEHLAGCDDLIVFADEHHTYYGAKFSEAIRDLHPYALVGLTATPHDKTPLDQIIFRYPLACAIAERYVKTPVVVGRKDDRKDAETKLRDGIRLLEAKERALRAFSEQTGSEKVNPVMLVVAQDTDEADDYSRILREPTFAGGTYADAILVVHSNVDADKALEQLAEIEMPDCKYRIVISVGMLKEGWDAKNVYVIASTRASVSEILTEQTLGRGLRLPFGKYTGIELLDTLEVLAHERYEELLKRANVLNAQFIDYRTRLIVTSDDKGVEVVTPERSAVATPVTIVGPAGIPTDSPEGRPALVSVDARSAAAETEAKFVETMTVLVPIGHELRIPIVKMETVKSPFSLADITDLQPFRQLGEHLAADPDKELMRWVLDFESIGPARDHATERATRRAKDVVESPGTLFPLESARNELADRVMASSVVPSRAHERNALGPILDAFIQGLGPQAESLLSAYMDTATDRLVRLLTEQQRRFATKPRAEQVTESFVFAKERAARPNPSHDRFGAFARGLAYEGWDRCLYQQAWFDSSPERTMANILDAAKEVEFWVRLHRNDLPILYSDLGNQYNPDLVAVEKDGTHWLIEVKQQKEMGTPVVLTKRDAAKRWANYVSAAPAANAKWRHLLVSETDVEEAHQSWPVLKAMGDKS